MKSALTLSVALTMALVLSSCGKKDRQVKVTKDGVPLANVGLIFETADLKADTSERFEADTNSSGVAIFPIGDLSDYSVYNIILVTKEGEVRIAAGGSGEFARVGLWQEEGYKVSIGE